MWFDWVTIYTKTFDSRRGDTFWADRKWEDYNVSEKYRPHSLSILVYLSQAFE